jgi:hypothetical protein
MKGFFISVKLKSKEFAGLLKKYLAKKIRGLNIIMYIYHPKK